MVAANGQPLVKNRNKPEDKEGSSPNICFTFLCSMSGTEATDRQPVSKGFALAFLAVILWSGNFVAARALHGEISPVSLSFFRWLLATLVLFPIALQNVKREWKALLPHTRYLSFTALTGVTIFNTFVYIAGKYTTATNMALIGTTASPVFVFLISAFFLKQKLSPFQYTGISLCIIGILALLSKGNIGQLQHFRFTTGDLWILAAALSFAIYTILVRRKPHHLSSTTFLFALFFLGTLFLLPAFVIDLFSSKSISWNSTLIGALLYLGICASVIAFLSWNLSIRQLGAPRTALFGNLIPVFSSLEAAWLLGEQVSSVIMTSFLVIFAGILIANFSILKSLFMGARGKPDLPETKKELT
jgi:drug/metabolite transporter (DMT)-like permease